MSPPPPKCLLIFLVNVPHGWNNIISYTSQNILALVYNPTETFKEYMEELTTSSPPKTTHSPKIIHI